MATVCEALAETAVVAKACDATRMGISGAYAPRRNAPPSGPRTKSCVTNGLRYAPRIAARSSFVIPAQAQTQLGHWACPSVVQSFRLRP